MDKIITTLTKLPEVTPEIAEKLKAHGVTSIPAVFELDEADLKKVTGLTTAKVNTLKAHRSAALLKRRKP